MTGAALTMLSGEALAQSTLPGLDPDTLRSELRGRGGAENPALSSRERVIYAPRQIRTKGGPSSIERVFSERTSNTLRQFGYDTFTAQDSIVLRQTGAIQDSYVLGLGDEIVVNLRGQENIQYRQRVDRNGQIILPRLAPISAAGRLFGDFRADLEAAIANAFIATQAFVSLGEIRQISVLVAGEVHVPGVITLTGLSTPLDALIVSGGIKKTGSLRNIRVMRGGRALAVDLYSLLVGIEGEPAFHLQEGDRIVVPPLGRTVGVIGSVRRSAIYELSGQQTMAASELIALAGGVQVRGAYRFMVMRTRADGVRETQEIDASLTARVQDGDILFVQPSVNESIGRVSLRGHTSLGGVYSLGRAQQVRDLIRTPAALDPSPYLLFGVISRRDPVSFGRILMPFSPLAAMRDPAPIPLKEDDVVWVFSIEEVRRLASEARTEELERLERQRELFVAEQQEARQSDPEDVVSSRIALQSAGQNTDPLMNEQILAGAAATAAVGSEMDTTRNAMVTQNLQRRQAARDRELPEDQLDRQRIRTRGEFDDATTTLRASVLDAQRQDAMEDGARIEPLTVDSLANGLAVDRRAVSVFLTEYIATIRGAVRVPGHYLVAPTTRLAELAAAAGGLKRTADRATVEITATTFDNIRGRSETIRRNISLQETPLASIRVAPQDSIVVRDVFSERWDGRVNVFGEVRFPGAYEIVRGEKLSSLLQRAGGLTDLAFPYGAIFSRRSVARREQETNGRKAEDLQNLIISQTSRREVNAQQIQFLQALVSELKDQRSIGRIAVEVEPNILTARPELDIELEPGDALYIPSRPSTVTVTGQVLNAGSFQFDPGESAKHYIRMAGGYNDLADEGRVFVIYPDGTSERLKDSFWSLGSTRVVPGTVIVVPYDVSPFFFADFVRDAAQVTSQLAITAASVAAVTN